MHVKCAVIAFRPYKPKRLLALVVVNPSPYFFSNCTKSDQEFDPEFDLTLLASHSKPQNKSSQELDLGLLLTNKKKTGSF